MKNNANAMLGAIIGDITGSIYEFNNIKTKSFPWFGGNEFFTDDSIMSIAVAQALMEGEKNLGKNTIKWMQTLGREYPDGGYGGMFAQWIYADDPRPYNSFGNGSAMRVSAVGQMAKSVEEAKRLSKIVTSVTHNHPEGIKGAEAVATCVFLAKQGYTKLGILNHVQSHYYCLDFTLDDIRPTYRFNETCQETVPQALEAFFESSSFEDAIRNAISIGGDSDTLAAITGAVAGTYYGINDKTREKALGILDDRLRGLYLKWEGFNSK